jgi:hypothetical protein
MLRNWKGDQAPVQTPCKRTKLYQMKFLVTGRQFSARNHKQNQTVTNKTPDDVTNRNVLENR